MPQEVPVCLVSATSEGKAEHLQSLFDTQRHAIAHLLADLDFLARRRSLVAFGPERGELNRRLRQIESTLEAYRRAEAKIEILISRFGGTK
jgi:hypothetical protein